MTMMTHTATKSTGTARILLLILAWGFYPMAAIASDGSRERAVAIPTAQQATLQEARLEPQRALPFDDVLRLPLERNAPIAADIVRLRQTTRPTAVAGLIVPIGFDSIKAPATRAAAHIGQEPFKAGTPLVAHANAARAIVFIACLLFVVATRLHRAPRAILARAWTALRAGARFAMRQQSRTRGVIAKATATLHQSAAKIRAGDDGPPSAVAAAVPRGPRSVMSARRRATDYGQSSESLPLNIDNMHRLDFTMKRAVLVVALALAAITGMSAQGTLAPLARQTIFDNSGKIVNGSCVWSYVAGTTTPATTWTDSALAVPNSNPIKADSAGRVAIYLSPGNNYKFAVETSCTAPAHGSVLWTQDNVSGVPSTSATVDITGTAGETLSSGACAYLSDGSGAKTAGQWFKCDSANTYSSTLPETGIAPSAIVSAASGTIRIAGSVTGLSSLSVGSTYYVGTAGAITTTAPASARVLGVADTASSLVLTANPSTGSIYSANVHFPAIQVPSSDVNTLDDYEEGTWTPVLGGSGGTSGQTYAAQSGYYIKIGKFVWATCVISLSTKGTITATAQVQGFPFTSENSSNNSAAGIITNFSNLATNWSSLTLVIQANSTAANIQGVSAASTGQTNLATGDIANNTNLTATIMYRATQ